MRDINIAISRCSPSWLACSVTFSVNRRGLLQLMPRSARTPESAAGNRGDPGGQGGFQHRFCLGLCEAKRRRQLRGKVRRVSAGLKNDAIVYGLLHVRGHIPDHIFTHAPCTAGAFGQSLRIAAADAPLRQERQETLQDGGAGPGAFRSARPYYFD